MISKLSEVLEGALRASGLESTSLIWKIAEGWADIVGPRVAARAAPTRLRNRELVVSAPDAVWRQELTLLGPEIAAGVNRRVGKEVVDRIRLVAGPIRPPEAKRRRRRLRPPATTTAPPAPSELTDASRARHEPPAEGVAAALDSLARVRAQRLAADRLADRSPPLRRRGRGR